MVKKTLFIMTHLGSGWEKLVGVLDKNPNIQVFNTGMSYNHPSDVHYLTSQIHKQSNSASVWVDLIFYNKDFTMKRLTEYYKFIFWTTTLDETNSELTKKYGKSQLVNYYNFRISGISQYCQRVKNPILNPDLKTNFFLDAIF